MPVLEPHPDKRGFTPGCIQAMSSVPDDECETNVHAERQRAGTSVVMRNHAAFFITWGLIASNLDVTHPSRIYVQFAIHGTCTISRRQSPRDYSISVIQMLAVFSSKLKTILSSAGAVKCFRIRLAIWEW